MENDQQANLNRREMAKEDLKEARQDFFSSLKVTGRKLKIYTKASIKSKAAFLRSVPNSIIESFKNLRDRRKGKKLFKKEEKRKRKEVLLKEKKIFKDIDQIYIDKARKHREQKRAKKEKRKLKFKEGEKQKTDSKKSKLFGGFIQRFKDWRQDKKEDAYYRRVEKERLREIKANTLDHKRGFKEAFAQQEAERKLQLKQDKKQKTNSFFSRLGKIKNSILSKFKSKNVDKKFANAFQEAEIAGLGFFGRVTKFTSDQINKFREYRETKREDAYYRRVEKERLREIKANTLDHKRGFKEAFAQQEAERKLQLKQDKKQKTSSFFAKCGSAKNSVLDNLSSRNVYLKFQNALDSAKIAGLSGLGSTLRFTSEQVNKLRRHREERREDAYYKRLEVERLRKIKENTQEHKRAFEEIFAAQDKQQERMALEQKHQENLRRKQELLIQLRNDLNSIMNRNFSPEPDVTSPKRR